MAAVNRGYTLTSTVEGAGDALGVRRTYGPLTGFQPNEFREHKIMLQRTDVAQIIGISIVLFDHIIHSSKI